MRLEGSMRRLKGDKTDLNRSNIGYIFLFSLLIACTDIYGQQPLNGFCSYRKIQVKPAFGKIFTFDFDNDNQTDFLLFNPLNNNVAFQKNNPSENKITSLARSSVIAITDLKPVIQLRRKELLYFAISQKDRKAALLSISKGGGISIRMQYKFDSYPSSLSVADMNGDGNSEAVVCGNNFKGISLFLLKNKLEEINIVRDGVFSSVQFIDLNYDGFPDIAAYEARKNCIYLFINDQNGNFRKMRSLKFDPSVRSFKTADVNSDGYMDLVLLKNKGINILEGDSVSSFRKNYFIHTPVAPDEITVDDYNGDGMNDLAYMNKSSGELFLQINKGNSSYYYSILLLKKSGYSDMKSFRDSFLKRIVLLNPDGELYVFSKFDLKRDFEKLSAFGEASALASFENRNPDRKDLCVVDNYQKALIVLSGEPGNPVSKYYSVRTSAPFSKVAIDDSRWNEKTFFLYSPSGNLIEIIKYNFDNLKIEKNTLYVKGGIIDLKLRPSGESNYPNIYILSNRSEPSYSIYQFKSYHYSEISSGKSGRTFIDAAITSNDTLSLFSWSKSNYGSEYSYSSFGMFPKDKFLYKYDNKLQDAFGLYTQTFPVSNKNEYINFSLISNGSDVGRYFIRKEGNKKVEF